MVRRLAQVSQARPGGLTAAVLSSQTDGDMEGVETRWRAWPGWQLTVKEAGFPVLGGLGCTYQVWVVRKGGEWMPHLALMEGGGILVPDTAAPPGASPLQAFSTPVPTQKCRAGHRPEKGPQSAQRPPESDCFHPGSTLCQEPPGRAQLDSSVTSSGRDETAGGWPEGCVLLNSRASFFHPPA